MHKSFPAPLTAEAVYDALPRTCRNVEIRSYDVLDSTNTEAKRIAHDRSARGDILLHPLLLIANTQTEGRGRLGRTFYSPADTGLYVTLLYATRRPPDEAVAVTGAAAVAVATALEAQTNRCPRIKWVNDIYLDDAKVCGILTESVIPPADTNAPLYMAVGIGMNVSTAHFPDGFRAPAVSLATGGQTPPDRASLAAAVTAALLARLDDPAAPEVVEAYRARSYLTRTPTPVICTCGHEVFEGIAEGIGDDYSLLIRRTDDRLVTVSAGEVSVKPAARYLSSKEVPSL